jgi:hypothetical protein
LFLGGLALAGLLALVCALVWRHRQSAREGALGTRAMSDAEREAAVTQLKSWMQELETQAPASGVQA